MTHRTRLQAAFDFSPFDEDTRDRLSRPRRVIESRLTIARDDGTTLRVPSWRVQYDDHRGPFKGGLRYHPAVNRNEFERLAMGMTLKCALHKLPLGGAKGGIAVDPHEVSENELERLTKAFARELAPYAGPSKDVPAPDVNTGEREMEWYREAMAEVDGTDHLACVTGKPVERGGIAGRDIATGTGAFFVIDEVLKDDDRDNSTLNVAVQGLGNAARPLLRRMYDAGYKVVAVSDSSGAVHAPDGLDIPAVLEAKEVEGSLEAAEIDDLADGSIERIANEELITLDVEILVPAALGDVVTEGNVQDVKAEYIFEVANVPVTDTADDVLAETDTEVFPDILVNGGGVVVSWMEWRNNINGTSSAREDVIEELEERMREATRRTAKRVRNCSGNFRICTILEAIDALAEN